MKEKITKLIDLKSIITLSMSVALIVGFFMGRISTEVFIPFACMVFTYYFTRKKEGE